MGFDDETARLSELTKQIQVKMETQQKQMEDMKNQMSEINNSGKKVMSDVGSTNKEIKRHENMITNMCRSMDNMRRNKKESDERIVDLQCRSMKMNLIFTGLGQEWRGEDTEWKIRNFLDNELGIKWQVNFGNVHRFGRFTRGKPRPIVARFLYQKDLDAVRDRSHLLRGTPYRIHQQFPAAVEDRRRTLQPHMQRCLAEGSRVKLVRDRLYVDGELYIPEDDFEVIDHEPQREQDWVPGPQGDTSADMEA